MRDHAVISNRNQIADKSMRLYFATLAYHSSPLDFDEWTYKCAFADHATVKVRWFDDSNVRAELDINDSDGTKFGGCVIISLVAVTTAIAVPFPLKGRARSKIETTVRAWLSPVIGTCDSRCRMESTTVGILNLKSSKSHRKHSRERAGPAKYER